MQIARYQQDGEPHWAIVEDGIVHVASGDPFASALTGARDSACRVR